MSRSISIMWGALAFILCAGMGARVLEAGVDWSGANAADWFQGVGSVAAVAAAVGIALYQSYRARLDRLEERQEFRMAVAALGRRLAEIAEAEAEQMISSPDWYRFEGITLWEYDLLDAALQRFDPSRLASADGVLAMEKLRSVGRSAASWANLAVRVDQMETYFDGDLDDSLRGWAAGVAESAKVLEELARRP